MINLSDKELIDKLNNFSIISELDNTPLGTAVKFYFDLVAEVALRDLIRKDDLPLEQQIKLKAKVEICRYEFQNMVTWFKNEAYNARQELDERRLSGELELTK